MIPYVPISICHCGKVTESGNYDDSSKSLETCFSWSRRIRTTGAYESVVNGRNIDLSLNSITSVNELKSDSSKGSVNWMKGR